MIVALILLVMFIALGIIAAAWAEAQVLDTIDTISPVIPEEAEEPLDYEDFANAVREEYAKGDMSYADLAEEFSTSKSTIGRIVRHEWKA